MKPTAQIPFDLPVRPALGRDDFVISTANATAVAMIDADDGWPGGKLLLTGPEASGKTHLAHVWAAQVDAVVVEAAQLARLDVPTLACAKRVVVEDIPAIAGQKKAEAALFHLHNLTLADGGRLLLTGRTGAPHWGIRLADLASRLIATTMVPLDPPNDILLAALLTKHFRDRQLDPPDAVIGYLLTRMRRSGAAARTLAADIDRLSLARKQPLTVPLVREALEQMEKADLAHVADTAP